MGKAITPPWTDALLKRIEEETDLIVSRQLDLCILYAREFGETEVEDLTAEQLRELTAKADEAGLLEARQ